jgi:hypothetical protein
VAAQFRRLGSRSKRAPQVLSRQLHEQERVGSKVDRIARELWRFGQTGGSQTRATPAGSSWRR